MGRLLYELNAVDERTVQKYKQESQKAGKGSFALAWIMDQSDEERKRSGFLFSLLISFSGVSQSTLRVRRSRLRNVRFMF
jgi:translation elongation factor EF-1alpha